MGKSITSKLAARRGRPPNPVPVSKAERWEREEVVQRVQDVLTALEVPPIDKPTRQRLQKIFHRRELLKAGDGSGHVTLLIRTILESEGNADALIEPIVRAVSMSMHPKLTAYGVAFIAAFDSIPLLSILESMRALDLFHEATIAHHLENVVTNKLLKILKVPTACEKPARKAKTKPPMSIARPPQNKRKLAKGERRVMKLAA